VLRLINRSPFKRLRFGRVTISKGFLADVKWTDMNTGSSISTRFLSPHLIWWGDLVGDQLSNRTRNRVKNWMRGQLHIF
jgi:hypothetical protein